MPDTDGIIVELAVSGKSEPRKLGFLVGVFVAHPSPLRSAQTRMLIGICKLKAQAYCIRLWE